MENKQHNAGAFQMTNGVAKEISWPIPFSNFVADADRILANDHELSALRKTDHEKAMIQLCQRIQDGLPFSLTDAQESRLLDFLIENY